MMVMMVMMIMMMIMMMMMMMMRAHSAVDFKFGIGAQDWKKGSVA